MNVPHRRLVVHSAWALALGSSVLLGLFLSSVDAQSGPAPWELAAAAYARGISQSDAALTEANTTPAFWTRVAPRFAGAPTPGALGSISGDGLVQNGSIYKQGFARVTLLCSHPDGVEEFVTVTVKEANGEWRVSGGYAP